MATLSFSQSLSNSLNVPQFRYVPRQKRILNQNLLQSKQEESDCGNVVDEEEGGQDIRKETSETCQEIGAFKKFMLTFVSFGYSCSIEFEAIYGVVSMQYFGLPLYLVSLPGLISGAVNSFLVPLVGYYSDKGPNPLKRKLTSLVVTTLCLVVAYTTLGVCSWIKLVEIGEAIRRSNGTALPSIQKIGTWNKTSPSTNGSYSKTSGSDSPIPIIAIVSVLPFVLFDTGYDTCASMSRASVLDVVSARHRNSVLTMSGMMTGLAGITVGIMGVMDFPTIFGSAFEMDGFALTLILLSTMFAVCGVTSSVCSIMTIWKFDSKNNSMNKTDKPHQNAVASVKQNEFSEKPYHPESLQDSLSGFNIKSQNEESDTNRKNSSLTSVSSLSTDNTSRTFLLPSSEKQRTTSTDYRSFVSNAQNHSSTNLHDQASPNPGSEKIPITTTLSSSQKNDDIDNPSVYNGSGDFNTYSFGSDYKWSIKSLQLSFSKSYEKVLGQITLQKLRENERNQKQKTDKPKSRPSLWSGRLLVCIVSIFLCNEAVTATTMYHSNTLTTEVFRGDPLAFPGSPGRILYEKGIRMSSFGTLVAFISYFCFNMATPKLLDRFGALKVFMTVNFLVAVSCSVYCGYPALASYFFMMVLYGANKAVLLGVAYILGITYAPLDTTDEPGNSTGGGDQSSSPSKFMGKLMALISVTVPTGYVLLSIMMGPWMDAVGSTWPPVYFTIGSGAGAVITGLVLLVLK